MNSPAPDSHAPQATAPPGWASAAVEDCISRVRHNLAALDSDQGEPGFPERTQDGHWVCVPNGGWVGGHWVGLIWLSFANSSYAHTGDSSLERAARTWAARLAPRQHDTTTHDLGFLFELSHLLGAQLTGDAALKAPALAAAKTLALRFNPRGGFIQAWGALDAAPEQRGRTIIDTLMNLRLLFWASQESGDPQYAHIAAAHARTCLARNVRPDHSTAHVADFDPDSGAFLKQDTHQGLSPTSCWSRGQSWGVYGFAEAYRNSQEPAFLAASRSLADYALAHLPPDGVPYWDYASPLIPEVDTSSSPARAAAAELGSTDVRDSSAAAILAAGLLKLADLDTDGTAQPGASRWRANAERILASLYQHYTSRGTPEPSILLHGTRSKPHGLMDHGLIYGDYYYLEALTRLLQPGLLDKAF